MFGHLWAHGYFFAGHASFSFNKIFLSYMYGIHQVLFQNDSLATLLARVVGILGPIDPELLAKGRDTHKFFTKNHMLYERNQVCHYILSGGLLRTVVLVLRSYIYGAIVSRGS
jgi:hypothetical protein